MNIETGLRYAALAAVAVAIGMGVKKQLLIFRTFHTLNISPRAGNATVDYCRTSPTVHAVATTEPS